MRNGARVLICVLVFAPLPALARTWTDNQGQTVEGDFVRVVKGRVIVKTANGPMIQVPFGHLITEDQDFVREQLEAHGLGSQVPAKKKTTDSDSTTKGKSPEPDKEKTKAKEPAAQEPARLGPPRKWTDVLGRSVEARLVGMENGKVVLQVRGKDAPYPFDKFSLADQQYVRGEMLARGEGEKLPSAENVQPAPAPIVQSTPPVIPHATPRMPQYMFPVFTAPEPGTPEPASPAPTTPVQPAPVQPAPVVPSFAAPAPPSFVPPSAPNFAANMPNTGPQTRQVKVCKACGKVVPDTLTAGDHCPHCGVYFGYDETTGKTAHLGYYATPAGIGSLIVGVIVVLARLARARGNG